MVNNAQLVVFRFLFGLLMLIESWGAIGTGWVYRAFVLPRVTFPIFSFGWPQPLPGYWMYGYFITMGLTAAGVMLGWRYRLTSTALAIMWTGAYLFQKTHYNNHYYLAVMFCWAMVLLPADRRASLDARRTDHREQWCPKWIVTAFKLQVLIVFVYAAIAKVYPGWWSGDYIGVVFGAKTHYPVIGPLLGQRWFQMFITYSGIFFDALVIPALWWRPTRLLALVGLVIFNVFNSVVFQIGIFPYLVLALAAFFFTPQTVEYWFRWLPGLGTGPTTEQPAPPMHPALRAVLVGFFALQVLLPVRHYLIPGDVAWTEEGHRLSWRMMMHTKSGNLRLVARDPATDRTWVIDQSKWLTPKQRTRVATKPEFLYQLVQILKADFARQGLENVEIYAERSRVSLNGSPASPLYDPEVDLTKVSYDTFWRSPWVLDQGLAAP